MTGILSGTSTCLIFPGIIIHFFSDYRSIESIHYLQSSTKEFINRIQFFYEFINIDFIWTKIFRNNYWYNYSFNFNEF
jgi:hypothetical protein